MKKTLLILTSVISLGASVAYAAQELQEHNPASITLFAHGLGAHRQKNYLGNMVDQIDYYKFYGFIEKTGRTFDTYKSMQECSLGQEHEMGNLDAAIGNLLTQSPNTDLVLQGVSLGASTITNYLGTAQVNPRIKGAILESPFAHVQTMIDHIQARNSWLIARMAPRIVVKKIASLMYPNHNLAGAQPITSVVNIPHDISVLLIASKEDALISWEQTQALYAALLEAGHPHAHFYVTDHGAHARACLGNDTVRNIVHAFRRKYNLGNYNEEYAQAGQEAFEQTQNQTQDGVRTTY